MIVWGHFLPLGNFVKVIIYSFHVPLFVFVSGLLIKKFPVTASETVSKLHNSIVRLLLPYSIWFIACAIPVMINKELSIKKAFKHFIFYSGDTIWNRALWFLPSFFMISFFFTIFGKFSKGNKIIIGVSSFLAFIIAIYIDISNIKIFSYFGLENSILLYGFYSLGYLLKDLIKKIISVKLLVYCCGIIFLIIAYWAGLRNNGNNISFLQNDYNGILFYIFTALILIPTFIIGCSILPKVKVIELISSNSLFIMCSHMIILEFIKIFVGKFTFINGTICTFSLIGIYIIVLLLLRKIKSEKIKNKLTYIGIQV